MHMLGHGSAQFFSICDMNVSLSDKFQAAQHETKLYKQENSKY